jgi:hypothetical protein
MWNQRRCPSWDNKSPGAQGFSKYRGRVVKAFDNARLAEQFDQVIGLLGV